MVVVVVSYRSLFASGSSLFGGVLPSPFGLFFTEVKKRDPSMDVALVPLVRAAMAVVRRVLPSPLLFSSFWGWLLVLLPWYARHRHRCSCWEPFNARDEKVSFFSFFIDARSTGCCFLSFDTFSSMDPVEKDDDMVAPLSPPTSPPPPPPRLR